MTVPIHFAVTDYAKPAGEPVSLTLAKTWLRVSGSDDDALIAGLIAAARNTVETDCALRLMPQTVDVALDAWPDPSVEYGPDTSYSTQPWWNATFRGVTLPVGPLASVTSITTTDLDGNASVLAASNYTVDTASIPPRIGLASGGVWPTNLRWLQPIVIRCAVGYADAADVAVSSITQTAGVATVTTATPHGLSTSTFGAAAYVTIAGANQAAYNGVQEVIVTGASTFTFVVDSGTTTPATGTITITPHTIPAALLLAVRLQLQIAYDVVRSGDIKALDALRIVYDSIIANYRRPGLA